VSVCVLNFKKKESPRVLPLTRLHERAHTNTPYTAHTQEVDRRERVNLCLSLHDLRNNYFILWDSITKNLEKIKKPRSAVEMPFT